MRFLIFGKVLRFASQLSVNCESPTPSKRTILRTQNDFKNIFFTASKIILSSKVGLVKIFDQVTTVGTTCTLSLVGQNGEVQNAAGLNWGQNPSNHTTKNDAYIKIRIQDIKDFPILFSPKQLSPRHPDGRGRLHRHNDKIDIVWDDGTNMEGIFFGNQIIDGVMYPKQVGSFPTYSEMGKYFRQRLKVPSGQPVRRHHLDRYGRTDVSISLLGKGVYKFDFFV